MPLSVIDWSAIEAAIQVWVVKGSGLADGAVIWADQNGTRPAAPYITMRLEGVVPLGAVDELTQTYDPDAPAGQEIVFATRGLREFTVSVNCYSFPTVGQSTARVMLYSVQNALSLPSVRAALQAAGLSPFDRGEVQNLAELLGADYAGRALLEVRFYVNDSATESTGYIATVAGTGTIGDSPDLPWSEST